MRPALLLVDLQRDFLDAPGLAPAAPALVGNVARLLAAFRATGQPVVHARTLVHADPDDRMPHWRREGLWRCLDGTPGAQPPAELAERPDEPVLPKTFFSPFQDGRLDAFLRPRANLLVVAGVHEHACVRSAVLDAYQLGYEVWVAEDGIASYDPQHALASRRHLEGRACRHLPAAEIARRLGLPWPDVRDTPACTPVHAGGAWQRLACGRTWLHRNPSRSDELLYEVAVGDAAAVDAAAQAAARRQPAWAAAAGTEGAARLSAWAAALQARRTAVVSALVREIGKPVTDAEAEFDYALALIGAAAARRRPDETVAAGVRVRHRPLGVVGLITPWNNALAIPAGKIAPALANGNTVLWKPALPGLGIVVHLLDTLREAGFPPDCVNVATGDAQTGQAVASHPDVAAVSFTGSVAAGRAIASLCAMHGKALQAELGGNNGVVIGACGDLSRAAAELAGAVFSFSGQRCTAPRRLIVTADRHDEFVALFLARVAELRIGAPDDPDTQVGPLVSPERRDEVQARIAAALSRGNRLLYGGGVPEHLRQGCWLVPAVLEAASHDDAIVREESFGPLAVVLRAADFDAALDLCNDVEHGLVASLYSDDPAQRQAFASRAQAGILRFDDAGRAIHPEAPFGGWKASGLGPPEHGRWDDTFYGRPQAVYWGQAMACPTITPEDARWKN